MCRMGEFWSRTLGFSQQKLQQKNQIQKKRAPKHSFIYLAKF